MDILLVRHAIAVDRSQALEDADRPLTPRGGKRFRKSVRGLAQLDLRLDHVLHSPWLRAAQTAELMQPLVRGELEPTPHLADAPGPALLERIASFPAAARIALVGHEPWLGTLLSLLLTGSMVHADNLAFKKGGVAWVQGEPRPGAMVLRAALPPGLLRALASD